MGQKIEIGKIYLSYNDENLGTLEAEFQLDIETSKEDVEKISNSLTEINNVIVPLINQKLREEDNE